MKYSYDVFISYKRYGEWTPWVRDLFKPSLDQHLSMALGKPASIFIDANLEAGAEWPSDVRNGVATSRVLLPLFSKMYFGSPWCLQELYAAKYKEAQLGLRTSSHTKGIIVPVRIHDGLKPDLPAHLHECCDIHAPNFTDFALTGLNKSCPLFLDFEKAIKDLVRDSVVPAIERSRAKPLNEEWMRAITDGGYDCPPPANFDEPDFPSLG